MGVHDAAKHANKGLVEPLREPLRGYLGPDPLHKYDPDPDDAYPDEQPARLALSDAGADGRVEARTGEMFFVDYLRAYVERGGFLGLGEGAGRAALAAHIVPF